MTESVDLYKNYYSNNLSLFTLFTLFESQELSQFRNSLPSSQRGLETSRFNRQKKSKNHIQCQLRLNRPLKLLLLLLYSSFNSHTNALKTFLSSDWNTEEGDLTVHGRIEGFLTHSLSPPVVSTSLTKNQKSYTMSAPPQQPTQQAPTTTVVSSTATPSTTQVLSSVWNEEEISLFMEGLEDYGPKSQHRTIVRSRRT